MVENDEEVDLAPFALPPEAIGEQWSARLGRPVVSCCQDAPMWPCRAISTPVRCAVTADGARKCVRALTWTTRPVYSGS